MTAGGDIAKQAVTLEARHAAADAITLCTSTSVWWSVEQERDRLES